MRKRAFRITILVLGVFGILCFMSCGQPSNTNQSTNTANNSANAANTATARACTKAEIESEMNKIIEDAGLKKQHEGTDHPNNYKNFQYRVVEDGGWYVLVIQGGISDGKSDNPNSNSEFMEKLVKKVDQLIKKNCVYNAVFADYGTIEKLDEGAIGVRDIKGFDWSACDWPMIACPGGECRSSCDDLINP